jgi:hypothetical protein
VTSAPSTATIEARTQELLAASADFVGFVRSCTADEWQRTCAEEGWPVGVVAFHVARGHAVVRGWLQSLREGRDVTLTPAALDADNAAMASEAQSVTQSDVVELAEHNIEDLARFLRTLSDADLAMSARFGPGGGDEVSVGRLAGSRGHLDRHLASIRATLAR